MVATVRDIELPLRGAGGGGNEQPPGNGGGGPDDPGGSRRKPSQRRFSVAITLGMSSILMFFLVPCVALIFLERTSETWIPLRIPRILLANTAILLASSGTLEMARRRFAERHLPRFRKFWDATIALGILFLAGQWIAWLQLVFGGIHVASTQASSFFYILTGAHGVHLIGGIASLVYVRVRDFQKGKISQTTAVKIVSYYWHFMDGLWLFLFALLYFFH
jgi:cytochrome c oxidase subunit III